MNLTEKAFCERLFSLIKPSSKVIIAFSGGCDSLCLALLCSKVLPHENVHAVYVNHNIRGLDELKSEIELNINNCRILDIPISVEEIPRFKVASFALENDCGTEAAARALRYEILENKRRELGFDFILTAHHLDDQIETVLMKKLQNSPLPSMRGISYVSGFIARPLLTFKREQIEDFVSDFGLKFSTDSTNSDNSILRNKIRNEILPGMRATDPDCDSKILALREEALKECGKVSFTGTEKLNLAYFLTLPQAQKLLCLYSMWDYVVGTGRGLSQSLVSRVVSAAENGKTSVIESNGGCFEINRGFLYLSNRALDKAYRDFNLELDTSCSSSVSLLENRLIVWGAKAPEEVTKDDLFLSAQLFAGKAVIRYPKENDRIVLKDGSKLVSKLLQDLGVPSSLRSRVPLICDDEGPCAVFASSFGFRNRIARKFCDVSGERFVLSHLCHA